MGIFEICLIIFCSLAVCGVAAAAIYRRVKGDPPDCGCGCNGCPHACGRKKK